MNTDLSADIKARLAHLDRPLTVGNHADIDSGYCIMEAVAYVAGEPWTDTPECACPVTRLQGSALDLVRRMLEVRSLEVRS